MTNKDETIYLYYYINDNNSHIFIFLGFFFFYPVQYGHPITHCYVVMIVNKL